jgi:hypothetical protein
MQSIKLTKQGRSSYNLNELIDTFFSRFEMIIFSFMSGFNFLNTSQANLEKYTKAAAYAHSKGIPVGGYIMMASTVPCALDCECIDPDTGNEYGSTCMATKYFDWWFDTVTHFLETANFDAIETDGPYEGAACASTEHAYHSNVNDSYFNQWKRNMDWYHFLREKQIYINSPDPYWLE